jgi:hypothetical protein
MAMVAQINLFQRPSLPQLPAPPLWERLLLIDGWMTAVVLAGVTLAGSLLLIRRGRSDAGHALLLIGVLVSTGVFVLSVAVTTECERLAESSARLVEHGAMGRGPQVGAMLGEQVTVEVNGEEYLVGRASVVRALEALPNSPFAVREVRVLGFRAVLDSPGVARSHVGIRVVPEKGGWAGESWWELSWRRRESSGIWEVVRIRSLWIQGLTGRAPPIR